MDTRTDPSVGFVGWNPFQFLHFSRLITEFPAAVLVLEERRKAKSAFDLESLPGSGNSVLRLDKRGMRGLDGRFDVLVCQTVFGGIEEIRRSKIAMLQYGYAKEAHNFGAWRAFGDVCLTYGDYASRRIEPFCHCVATGNPRFADWKRESFRQTAAARYAGRLDPQRKTLLYAPTWGALSNFPRFSAAVAALSRHYNVILKVHHVSQFADASLTGSAREHFSLVCDTKDDLIELLALADVVISDFSGAIFDAIQGGVPLVLLGESGGTEAADSKSDHYSIEQARRNELGTVVEAPDQLAAAVARVIAAGRVPGSDVLVRLKENLFRDAENSPARAADVIRRLAAGEFTQTQSQHYIRKEMAALFRCRAEFPLLRQIKRILKRGGSAG